jgi:hypothetical protein
VVVKVFTRETKGYKMVNEAYVFIIFLAIEVFNLRTIHNDDNFQLVKNLKK